MYFEILFLGLIFLGILSYSKIVNVNKFITDNIKYFEKLKEEDYDFLVRAKYGEGVDPDVLFAKRIRNGMIIVLVAFFFFLTNLSYVKIIACFALGFAMFKMEYSNLKKYYKANLHKIDSLLPHYLKGLEILIQHYTVPVAIGKSVSTAPPIFRDGLITMINEINAGDSSINPYMEFAQTYPVRDSMRMMRLLYRLSLGRQERKQEQLLTFSKTISNLQQKARDTRYKERLEKMESKTMSMLVATGLGLMVFLIIAVLMMM